MKPAELEVFKPDEILVYLEAARVGLADAENFDALGMKLDLCDAEMVRLRNKLEEFLGR
jgi:hypothetical protein